jgi:hypothetical protein
MIVLVQDPAEPLASPDVQVGDLVRISDRWWQRTLCRSNIELHGLGWGYAAW